MIRAEIEGTRIVIDSPQSRKEDCQSIPGCRWDKNSRKWHAPISWAACKCLRGVFGAELEIGPKLSAWAKNELEERINPSLDIREALEANCHGLFDKRLYPFQIAGAQFLFTAKQALLSDPMGAGKTVQVIAAAKARTSLPALVVCPASMRRTWGREIRKWWPGVPVYVIEGTATQRAKLLNEAADKPGWVVINWEAVRLHSRLAPYGSIALSQEERTPKILNQIPFKLVVADEAHRMKDPKSKQTRAVWACSHNPMTVYRWALTGTPLTNAPDTLYPVLHFMDPLEWPSKTAFIERYCLKAFNLWGGLDVFGIRPDREDEFFSIFTPRFRRMPKEIILPQLPPITYTTRTVQMNPKQKKAYTTMYDRMWAETEEGDMVIAANPISQLTRLTQFASSFAEVQEDGRVLLSDPSSKLDAFMDDLSDLGEGLVIFAESRQLLRMLATRFDKRAKNQGGPISYSIVEGGQSADTRQNGIDAFQNGKVPYILVVVKAGGVGITLTRAAQAAFLQRPWSNVDYQQAIGRVHRIGSEIHEAINIINYITEDTVEMYQMDVLQEKAGLMEEIVRDKDAIKRMLERKPKSESSD